MQPQSTAQEYMNTGKEGDGLYLGLTEQSLRLLHHLNAAYRVDAAPG
jgi:hypothetical protein